MKKIAFIFILALLNVSVFAQMASNPIKIKIKDITPKKEAPAQSSAIDFSEEQSKVNVVYGRIDENGDTTLIVRLPEVDINLMNHYYEITGTAAGRRLVKNANRYPPALPN